MDRCTSVFSCKNKDKRISKRRILYLSYHQHPLTSGSQHVQDMAITSLLFDLRGPRLLVQPVFRERPASARTVTTWPMQQARRQRAACFVLPGSAASSAPRQTSTSVWSQDKADLYCMTRTLGATGINPISCSRWDSGGARLFAFLATSIRTIPPCQRRLSDWGLHTLPSATDHPRAGQDVPFFDDGHTQRSVGHASGCPLLH